MYKSKLQIYCLFVSFFAFQNCKEETKVSPRPDNELIGYIRVADEFLLNKDTNLTGIRLFVDQFQTSSNSSGQFRVNLGSSTTIKTLRCIPDGLSEIELPWSNFRLRYSGDFSEFAFMVDTLVYSPPSTTRCDSVGFSWSIDSLQKKTYTFTAYIHTLGTLEERGADLILGRDPSEVLQTDWGKLVFFRNSLGNAEFSFRDSIFINFNKIFRSGDVVYYSASGTSANNGNQPFWNVISQNRAGAFIKHPFKTPIRSVVLP